MATPTTTTYHHPPVHQQEQQQAQQQHQQTAVPTTMASTEAAAPATSVSSLMYVAIDYNNIGCYHLENGNVPEAISAFVPALSNIKQALKLVTKRAACRCGREAQPINHTDDSTMNVDDDECTTATSTSSK